MLHLATVILYKILHNSNRSQDSDLPRQYHQPHSARHAVNFRHGLFFFVKFSNTQMSGYLFQMWLSYKIISIVMKLNHWKTKLSTHTLLLNRLAYSFSFVFHCYFSFTELSWLLYLFICTELPYLLEPLGSQYSAFFN